MDIKKVQIFVEYGIKTLQNKTNDYLKDIPAENVEKIFYSVNNTHSMMIVTLEKGEEKK